MRDFTKKAIWSISEITCIMFNFRDGDSRRHNFLQTEITNKSDEDIFSYADMFEAFRRNAKQMLT